MGETFVIMKSDVQMVSLLKLLKVLYILAYYYSIMDKRLASPGRKAMFSVSSKTSKIFLNTEKLLSLFDTYISSIVKYGATVVSTILKRYI